MRRLTLGLTVTLGLVLGFSLGYLSDAVAARNSAGTYSLPSSVNPVVSGTVIASTWANPTLSDVATELTSSLDRSGRGAMLAPLKCTNGTAAAPSVTFDSDRDTGLYRATTNTAGMATNGVVRQTWADNVTTMSTDAGVAGNLWVDGGVIAGGGLSVDTSTLVVDATNNRVGIGDATPDVTLDVEMSAAGAALINLLNLSATGFSSFDFYNSSGTSVGSIGTGNSGVSAPFTDNLFIRLANGEDLVIVDDTTLRFKMLNTTGHFDHSGATNPASNTAFTDTTTPDNIVKAWGNVSTAGGSVVAINDGFNLTSVAVDGAGTDFVDVTFASAFAGTGNYACTVTGINSGFLTFTANNISTTVVRIGAFDTGGSGIGLDSTVTTFFFICMGQQ